MRARTAAMARPADGGPTTCRTLAVPEVSSRARPRGSGAAEPYSSLFGGDGTSNRPSAAFTIMSLEQFRRKTYKRAGAAIAS